MQISSKNPVFNEKPQICIENKLNLDWNLAQQQTLSLRTEYAVREAEKETRGCLNSSNTYW